MDARVIIFVLSLVGIISCNGKPDYLNKSLSFEQRTDDLLERLTLEEKISLMQNNSESVDRLGIKKYGWWNEALHGVARAGLATVFPQSIGMAASFNDSLLFEVFDAVSDEARVKNRIAREKHSYKQYQGLTFWTPNINIFRDPRWGRGQETYGEDPYLTGTMGVAVVKGLQGEARDGYDKSHACAKHYAVHSGPEWNRHTFDVENLNPRDLWETYLPAFKDLVQKADVKEVMCAYNRFEGNPCCGSDKLLTKILREEWGFDGIVVTDCGALDDFYKKGHHETHEDIPSAAAAALLSGTDLECGKYTFSELKQSIDRGLIKEEDIDKSVRRLLIARYEMGEMDGETPWDDIPKEILDCNEHKELTLKMARQTMTLLHNRNNTLPLGKDIKIAVLGPNANDSVMQWGNYNGYPSHTSTLLSAVKDKVGEDNVVYLPTCGKTNPQFYQSLFDVCSTEHGKGFYSEYWDNIDFKGEPIIKEQQTVPMFFNGGGETPFVSGLPLADFSARYTSVLKTQKDNEIQFRVQMRGEFELYVNGEKIATHKELHNRPSFNYKYNVKAGEIYNIELKYRHLGEFPTLCFDMGQEVVMSNKEIADKIKDVDAVIFAGGLSAKLEGEQMNVKAEGFKGGDRTSIELPAVQRNILKNIHAQGKKLVYVNFSGSAVGFVPEIQSCDAILQAWYPGQAGGEAVADVLFGDYNPSGKLPVTFYKNVEQLPDFLDYSMKGRTYRYFKGEPLFPFGFGLSYTTFSYGKAMIKNGCLVVPVTNIGSVDGEDVIQLYVSRPDDVEGPLRTLRGYKRVKISSGETVNVSIPLTDETFEWWDSANNTMRPLDGKYLLQYGNCSLDKNLQSLEYDFVKK